MSTYYIKSNYENHFYRIKETGEVIETENGKMQNIENWKITGAWYDKPFGNIGFIGLSELLSYHSNYSSDFRYKNGNPKFGLRDCDHGTHRLHGNKEFHGISYIYKEN